MVGTSTGMVSLRRRVAVLACIAIAALTALALAVAAFVRAGFYNVGADDPHLPATYAMLESLREASIYRRAATIPVPADLASEARMVQGAGNYEAMCVQCHLAPGVASTELSRGLYPAPPDLTRETVDAAEAFWVIKHGIKGSGMPAWGGSMDDAYVWNLAAFLQRLPTLDAMAYRAMVARSGGHSHGGGETMAGGASADGVAPVHPHGPQATSPDANAPKHVDPPGAAPHHH
jgi:mono/diheme cytochrome c family protein